MAHHLKFMIVASLCLSLAVAVLGVRHTPKALFPTTTEGICKLRVETSGYPCEEHTVTTEDGYILSLQRIPDGLSRAGGPKQPVLLQHGVLVDGATWLMNSPAESLPFILADNGFEVWIVNSRGTKWSRSHVSLSSSDSAYWNWSWDELVAYDLPATVRYVYNQTGQKMNYVGHSLGTLMGLASFSQSKLLDKIKASAMLSPIAYLGQISSPLAKMVAQNFLLDDLVFGLSEFDPSGNAVTQLMGTLCATLHLDCYDLLSSFTGSNCCLNSSTIDTFVKYEPQPTSTKNMLHLTQMIQKGNIAMYDYGSNAQNMKSYKQPVPPPYNMANIPSDLPLFFSYGGKDELSDVADVKHLFDTMKLQAGDKVVELYIENYAHADFIMGTNAKDLVYGPLMSFFKRV